MNKCELLLFLNALSMTVGQGKTQEELAFFSLLCSQLSTNFALLAINPPGCTTTSSSSSNTTSDTTQETVPISDEGLLTIQNI